MLLILLFLLLLGEARRRPKDVYMRDDVRLIKELARHLLINSVYGNGHMGVVYPRAQN